MPTPRPDATANVRWLGGISYAEGLTEQAAARDRVLAGAPHEILLLEHDPPVVTLGRRGGLVDTPTLERLKTEVVSTDRGGLATWHGPGQLVGYPIVDLKRLGWDVGRIVRFLGETMRSAAESFGVDGVAYDDARPGIYAGGAKLGSIGLHIHRGVTTHGFALNVDCGLEGFAAIDPCGDATLQITTIARSCGRAVAMLEVRKRIATLLLDGVRASTGTR